VKIDELLEQHDIDSIQKTTKITKENLKRILAKDFEKLNKAQVFGFLSILEREYGSIEDLREYAQEYFVDIEESERVALSIEQNRSFSISMKPKKAFDSQLIFAAIGFLVLLFVAFMAFDPDSKDDIQVPKITVDLNDTNATLDTNSSDTNSSDINSTIKNKANATSSNVEQNMTVPAKKQSPNKTIEDQTIDKSSSIDDNKSKIITKSKSTSSLQNNKTKTNHNNHKRDYIKVEDGNKSKESNL